MNMHCNNQHGYILFIILIFLQIFSLLSLNGLTNSIMSFKTNYFVWEKIKNLRAAKEVIQQFAEFTTIPPTCFIPQLSSNELAGKSLRWWHKNGCRLANYYYVIEQLGVNSCALIDENNESKASIFYRFSFLTLNSELVFDKRTLQGVIAFPFTTSDSCTEKTYLIKRGVQMIREI